MVGCPLAICGYVWSVLYDELPKASCAEADVTQALVAEAHVDGWLMQVEVAEEFAELGVSRLTRSTALEA